MNRKIFLKRLGLLTISAPALLAEQSQIATTNESVERMRFHNDGRVTYRDEHGNIINVIRYDT
jgi:hypothetical protein